jgi:osmotically-inducible protein OsmY
MRNLIKATLLTSLIALSPIVSQAEDNDSNRTEVKTFAHDAWITTKIKTELAKDASMKTLAMVSVDTVNDGDVTLSGTARTPEAAKHIEAIAKSTEGVKHVENNIKIKSDD